MNNDMTFLINTIKNRRRSLGYTQAYVAGSCGIKQANYSRMESGRQLPNTDTLIKILDVLDLRLFATPCDEVHYDILWQDEIVTRVILSKDRKKIRYEKIREDGIYQPFSGEKLDLERFYRFIKSRCYEDGRADLKIILDKARLKSNNPYDFIRISHGVTYSDDFWIRNTGETLTWKDVRIR